MADEFLTALEAANAAEGDAQGAGPVPASTPKKRATVKRRRRRRGAPKVAKKPPTVASVFEPFAEQLRSIDWRDPVKREAEVAAVIGQMFVAVALTPQLSDSDRERLQWLMTLSRQMVTFRDASAIDAARRQLSGEDDAKSDSLDGPQLEPDPDAVSSESVQPEDSECRARPAFRGRPRARALA